MNQRWTLFTVLWLCAGCGEQAAKPKLPQPNLAAQAELVTVPETERWELEGLSDEAWVVRTESNVPHIYARDVNDLARVHGFVAARDRFFLMDMMRRLGRGRLAEVFGEVALPSDLDSRGSGMTHVAKRVLDMAPPSLLSMMQAYAEGVNSYIEAVKVGALPAPSELKLAAPLLGYGAPHEAMKPFTLDDMGGVLAVVLFQQGYETDDIRRAQLRQKLEALPTNGPDGDLHKSGLIEDVFRSVAPIHGVTTTPGNGVNGELRGGKTDSLAHSDGSTDSAPLFGGAVPTPMLSRLASRLEGLSARLGKPERGEFGSNVWAVSGARSKSGGAILASDGHLALEVPSLFWRIGLDTSVLGGGDTQLLGVTFAGLPMVGAGTNGKVAWSNTYLYGDITDFYREVVTLDAAGLPVSTLHQGKSRPLHRVDESYQTAKIALLNSSGGAQSWPRWELFDGRRLIALEGRPATDAERRGDQSPGAGKTVVAMLGDFVVPEDMDGDGVITGISMDLTTLDVGDTAGAVWKMAHTDTVQEFHAQQRKLVGWAQNMMAVDHTGQILYSGYNATPCRGYLPRAEDGRFRDDANPRMLIDGAAYAGFEIPLKDGVVDESQGADPQRCVIPFDEWPTALNPPAGYVVNANNDFSGTSLDNKLGNDPWYLGGPWVLGYRAKAIEEGVAQSVVDGATVQAMSDVQGTHRSMLAEQLLPDLLTALNLASKAPEDDPLGALYMAEKATLDEVSTRLSAWQKAGAPAESGVATFYHTPTEEQRTHSVATMLFNAWVVELIHGVFDDEGAPLAAITALRGLGRIMKGRGENNPLALKSWDNARKESVLFDDVSTEGIESSEEVIVRAMVAALVRLRAKAKSPGLGGFGTPDLSQWRWGLRHMLRLDSILASFLGEVDGLSGLTELFAINTDTLPLADSLPKGDARLGLKHFPRAGDYGAVDAAHPKALRSAKFPDSGVRDFTYKHGPIMRMVISIPSKGAVEGVNILPGGQSSLTDSPHFADQIKLWLENKTEKMRFTPSDVVAGATGREVFVPASTR